MGGGEGRGEWEVCGWLTVGNRTSRGGGREGGRLCEAGKETACVRGGGGVAGEGLKEGGGGGREGAV